MKQSRYWPWLSRNPRTGRRPNQAIFTSTGYDDLSPFAVRRSRPDKVEPEADVEDFVDTIPRVFEFSKPR